MDSVTGELFESHDRGRGYEIGHNRFVTVEEEELYAARAAQPAATRQLAGDSLIGPTSLGLIDV